MPVARTTVIATGSLNASLSAVVNTCDQLALAPRLALPLSASASGMYYMQLPLADHAYYSRTAAARQHDPRILLFRRRATVSESTGSGRRPGPGDRPHWQCDDDTEHWHVCSQAQLTSEPEAAMALALRRRLPVPVGTHTHTHERRVR